MKFVSARSLAVHNGTKLLAYGPPGSWKTPCISTAPRVIALICETGVSSLKDIPVAMDFPVHRATTAKEIDEFKTWLQKSNEVRNYDTIAVDSLSQVAEHYLVAAQKSVAHGLKAYGKMADDTKEFFDILNNMPQKNVYMICKLSYKELASGAKRIPYFPGNALDIYIPHEVDEVYFASKQYIAGGPPGETLCWQTQSTPDTHARSRHSSIVAPFEPCHLGYLFEKIRKGSNP